MLGILFSCKYVMLGIVLSCHHDDVCGASEEEDPPDPLSDAIFHPKPGGLIPPRQSFLENENTFLLNFLSQIIDKDAEKVPSQGTTSTYSTQSEEVFFKSFRATHMKMIFVKTKMCSISSFEFRQGCT